MERTNLVLATLASVEGASFSPVQVQKLFFLIDKNIAVLIGGPHFNFEPYSYGPFDKGVYEELERLNAVGLVDIDTTGHVKAFRLTVKGQAQGMANLNQMAERAAKYVKEAATFVLSLPFSKLVTAIYRAYPVPRPIF